VKMILKPRKRDYIARVGIFLIVVALMVGMVGCDYYYLTMKVNPPGGGYTTPSETGGPYSCASDWPTFIGATPIGIYLFASWTATPTLTFHDPSANPTYFTMPYNDVTVTANFVPLDHFKCYWLGGSPPVGEVVGLKDQFGAVTATVEDAEFFCNPVEKVLDGVTMPISNPDHHLTVYNITTGSENATQMPLQVVVKNQFGTQNLTVTGPVALAVPTWKLNPGNHSTPVGLDHFLLYKVIGGSLMNVGVDLTDEFSPETGVPVYEPLFFATPVHKTQGDNVTEIRAPEAHLVFYRIEARAFNGTVQVNNQFGNQTLYLGNATLLAVPSEKLYP
jgi:hypothetical protein